MGQKIPQETGNHDFICGGRCVEFYCFRVQKNRPQKGKKSSNGQQALTKVNDKIVPSSISNL
jgi:hypothetical protein